MRSFRLLSIAVIGTIIGYTVINLVIVPLSIWQYLGIELVITVLHLLYNYAKREEQTQVIDE
jgi:uncharacterized membrane protein